MTEQQIDAELCRYEPLTVAGIWFWWPGDWHKSQRENVPASIYRRLHRKPNDFLARYPTREAALAALRRAIAATDTQTT